LKRYQLWQTENNGNRDFAGNMQAIGPKSVSLQALPESSMPVRSPRPKTFARILPLVFWGLFLLAGCGAGQLTGGDLSPPRVTFQSLAVGLPTPQGLPLTCALLVDNPNPREFRVLGYDYELWLAGQQAAQGKSGEETLLPARGQALVKVPILVKFKALPQLLPAFLGGEKVQYRVSGGVRLASLLGGMRVPFNFQGRVRPQEGLEQLRPFLKDSANDIQF
jgi:LEA14-like dessication related protein